MRGLLVFLMLALPLPALAQHVPDTPDNRAALARNLSDLEEPNMRHAIEDMMSQLELGVPPDRRLEFRAVMGSLVTYERIKAFSDAVVAQDMTADEITALIAFYSSPAGHAVMLKLPLIGRDTESLIQSLIAQALTQITSVGQPPLPRGAPL